MSGWIEEALCAQTDPEAFFPEKGSPATAAKQTCTRCPVRDECLTAALADPSLEGIWGGLTVRERREIRLGDAERIAA